MYPKQLAAFFNLARYSLVEASTKSGKTTGCIYWMVERCLFGQDGQNYWWVAPVFTQAKIAFTRIKRGLPKNVFKANEGELSISFHGGGKLWFKSGENPDNLYGEDVYAAVVDEASRVREEAWHAVRSTLTATRGPVRIIGNVKGRKNWFYALARRAEMKEPGMQYHKIVAADAIAAGVLAAEEIEDARRILPEAVFRELYLAEPSDDEGNPFGYKAIKSCIRPMSNASPVAWGWDLAKSIDWTVGIGLDRDSQTCRFERFQRPWQMTIEAIRAQTGYDRALVDSTGVGDPIVEALQSTGTQHFEGLKFTSPSKQQLMEGLAVAIQSGEIGYPEGIISKELEIFEYEYTRNGVRYSAPEGFHDDAVCALALAWKCKKENRGMELWETIGAM